MLKKYINKNIKVENDFGKLFPKLMSNLILERQWRLLESTEILDFLQQTKKKVFRVRAKLSHSKWFSKTLLGIEINKTNAKISKPIYLGLAMLGTSKTIMCEFWFDYIETNIENNHYKEITIDKIKTAYYL